MGALLHLLATTASAAPAPGIVLLGHAQTRAEERALVEALRIYTRDLDIGIAVVDVVSGGDPVAQAADVGRGAGAALVVWLDAATEPSLFAYRVATRQVHATAAAPGADLDLRSQTLALKIRALLVADTPEVRGWERAAPPPPASTSGPPDSTSRSPDPASRPPTSTSRSPDSTSRPPTSTSRSPDSTSRPPTSTSRSPDSASRPPTSTSRPPASTSPATPSPAVGLEGALAYSLDLPTDTSLLRHGLAVRVGLVFARLPLAIELDGAVAFRAERRKGTAQVGVSDVPIGVGLPLRLDRPRYQVSGGPRLALHVFDVDGQTEDGRTGAAREVAAGLGATAEARLHLGGRVALLVAASAEVLVPRHRFTIDDTVAVDLGRLLVHVRAGVVVRVF